MNRILRLFLVSCLGCAFVSALGEGRMRESLFLTASSGRGELESRSGPSIDVQRLLREKLTVLVGVGHVSPREADEMFKMAFPSVDRRGEVEKQAEGKEPGIEIARPESFVPSEKRPLRSGPQSGERLSPLAAVGLRAELKGKRFDAVSEAGDRLHLLILAREARTFVRFIGNLAQQLEGIERSSGQAWEMSLIYLNDDPEDVVEKFEFVDKLLPGFVSAGYVSPSEDPSPVYGMDSNVIATVIVAKGAKVLHNFCYDSDAFFSQPHILGALAEAMDVDHKTLRDYIGGIAGDQVTAREQAKAN